MSMEIADAVMEDNLASLRTEATPLPGDQPDHELTVVLPAFNEEDRLPWTLLHLKQFLDQWGIDYRVIVADDGSSDSTAAIADGLGSRFSTVRLDRHRGKGAAVRNAVLRATGRIVGFTDADLPFELGALRRAFRWIEQGECEVVFGARDMHQFAHHARRRISRTIATWAFRKLVKWLVSRQVTDTQCGLKLFSHRAAREIFSRATIEGFAFDAEVVFLAERLALPFRRVPVHLIREYASSLSISRDALPMAWDVVRLWFRGRSLPRPGTPLVQSFRLPDEGREAA
jgi:dolichyl-phosphate beta-glucosyltransferase